MTFRLMAHSSLRDRIRHLLKTDFGKLEIRIIGISTFVGFVTAVNFLTYQVGPTENINLRTLKSLLLILLIEIVGLIVLLTSIAYLMIAVRDRNKDIVRLKLTVKQAISKALEQSSFNPHLVEHQHEQLESRTRQSTPKNSSDH
jgi:hypothetical protein